VFGQKAKKEEKNIYDQYQIKFFKSNTKENTFFS
jgi:hypothetical protein